MADNRQPCQRCGTRPRRPEMKFCFDCMCIIIRKMRDDGYLERYPRDTVAIEQKHPAALAGISFWEFNNHMDNAIRIMEDSLGGQEDR